MTRLRSIVLLGLFAVLPAIAQESIPLAPFPKLSAPRAVTKGPHDHFLANYFGINAWSPDNRYLLTLETDIKDKLPDGAPCTLGLVDLEDGNRFIPVMKTRAWNFQEAAMAHWLPKEKDTFVVNDFRDGKFVAVVRNWRTGKERVYPFPVSAVSEDGTWALSINYARLFLTRPDYGYYGNGQDPRCGVVFPEDDGLWRVNLKTGETKLIVSCADVQWMVPKVAWDGMSYICHTVISKDMKRVYFLSRSVDQSMFGVKQFQGVNWHTTAFTCNADGTNVRRCFPDGWGSSHFNWKPALSERDARLMIVTCKWLDKTYTHVEFAVGEEDYPRQVGGREMDFDGHCIYSPDGNFITSDGYWDENFYRHWKIVRLADNKVGSIGDFFVPEQYRDVYCRCDLHPRWRPDGRQLAFNSVHEGSRQVYIIDAQPAEQWPSVPSNLGFECGTEGWQIPGNLWRVVDGEGRRGSRAIVWENTDQNLYSFPRNAISLEAGGIYRYGAWVKVDALSCKDEKNPKPRVTMDFANAEGKWIGSDYAKPVGKPDADGWVYYEGLTGPLTTDTVRGNLFGFVQRHSTGRVRFDDFFFSHEGTRRVGTLVSSVYRDTADSGPVRFVATLFFSQASFRPDSLSPVFKFKNADGADVEVAPDELDAIHAAVTLDVSHLAAGSQPVTFVMRTKADGRELGRAALQFTRAEVRRRVSFDRFGRTLVDGKPFFPLGMYARDITPEVLSLYMANDAPYNCIMPYHAPSAKMLDACRDAGLMVVYSVKDLVYGCHPDNEKFRSREESFRHIAGMVREAKGHPAVLAYYANDESPTRQADTLCALREMIHGLDPDHPVWHVVCKANTIAPFLGAYDVIGMDPYPIGLEGPAGDIGKASGEVRIVQENTFGTVPVWHVPQAFNWVWQKGHKSGRFPTDEELVSMTWQPIAAGANGLVYFAFHRICMDAKPEERDEYIRRSAAAAAEVKAKIPLILSDPGPKVVSAPKGAVCRTWASAPGRVTLLAANSTRNPVSGTVTLAGLPPQTVELAPIGHVFIEIETTEAKQKKKRKN